MMERTDIDKKKRIARLKRLIIGTLFVAILLPIVCCIYLLIVQNRLNRQLAELTETVARLESNAITETQLERTNELLAMAQEDETEVGELPEQHADVSSGNQSDDYIAAHQVYLTFDDGPSTYTGVILDILKTYGVKATFFVVGKDDEESLAMYSRIVNEGHTLAMHSYSHVYSDIYKSVENFEADYKRIHDLLYDATGVEPKFYRFPGGSSNSVTRIPISEFGNYLHEQDVEYFDWNISSGDASGRQLSVNTLIQNATSGISERHTNVILMHDASDKYSTVLALPGIIEAIMEMEDTVILPITSGTNPVQHVQSQGNESQENS